MLSLVLSTFSAVVAPWGESYSIYVSVAPAAAGLCIAIERALGIGARWRYHTEMKNSYRILQDGIDFMHTLPDDKRESFLNDWWNRLIALRAREGQIPNSGGGAQG